jgi:hypothetical protein
MIETIIEGRARDLGGFTVARILPSPARRRIGPVVFFDHMGPAQLAPGEGIDVRRIRTSGCDGYLSVRGRSCTATARRRAADRARRDQLDDRGPRHRPLGANRLRDAAGGSRLHGVQL